MSSAHKLLDPKNDIAFKRIFGTEKNKDILIHFLNDMLAFKCKKPIQDVEFLKPILDPEIYAKKTSTVDVLCKDEDENTYIVEMQVAKAKGFEKRAQFYASKAYCTQANVGHKYINLKEVVFLAIADYVMFPNKKALKSDHVVLDRDTFENDLKDFSFTFLELGKFKKAKEDIDSLSDFTEKWCYFFKYAEEVTPEELQKLIGGDVVIKKAYEELDRFYWTEEELMSYDAVIKREKDYQASLDQKFDEGEQVGIGKRNREIAVDMISMKMDDESILKCSRLTSQELAALKTSLSTKNN
jgi:predicted transposase/invertase (TIGR01784 family)